MKWFRKCHASNSDRKLDSIRDHGLFRLIPCSQCFEASSAKTRSTWELAHGVLYRLMWSDFIVNPTIDEKYVSATRAPTYSDSHTSFFICALWMSVRNFPFEAQMWCRIASAIRTRSYCFQERNLHKNCNWKDEKHASFWYLSRSNISAVLTFCCWQMHVGN